MVLSSIVPFDWKIQWVIILYPLQKSVLHSDGAAGDHRIFHHAVHIERGNEEILPAACWLYDIGLCGDHCLLAVYGLLRSTSPYRANELHISIRIHAGRIISAGRHFCFVRSGNGKAYKINVILQIMPVSHRIVNKSWHLWKRNFRSQVLFLTNLKLKFLGSWSFKDLDWLWVKWINLRKLKIDKVWTGGPWTLT